MPINPTLYDLLQARIGPVRISNEGTEMSGRYRFDTAKERTEWQIDEWGESYVLDCPFCCDSRQRLSINHRYGVYDPVTETDNLSWAKCYNEDCLSDPDNRTTLKEHIFGFINCEERRQLCRLGTPARVSEAPTLRPAESPGELCELTDLAADHDAITYLRKRGFSPDELSASWHVQYCVRAGTRYPMAQDRIIIPVFMNAMLVGWQARYPGEQDWKLERLPKYFCQPGMPKRLVLYNHDVAAKQPLIVVCEGPSDVWRVGPAGVGLLGKQATLQQRALLATQASNKPLLILLDGDARADACRLKRQLEPIAARGLADITLPYGRDPGSYERDELWSLICHQAATQGVSVPVGSMAGAVNEVLI